TIDVRDANNCTFSTTVSIGAADGPTAIVITHANATCGSNNGTLTLGAVTGGVSPYTYSVDGGAFSAVTSYNNLAAGSHTIDVRDANNCTFSTTVSITSLQAPSTPTIGTITQPTCLNPTGSVILNGLPAGNWTINPGAIEGTGPSTSISGLATGTFNYTVTNAAGCTSPASADVVINTAPGAPAAPTIGMITQPTCNVSTGSVILNNLPEGNWTINPGGITGNTTSKTLSDLVPGPYVYTVTNSAGCVSGNSLEFEILKAKDGYVPKITIKYNDLLICYNLDDSIRSYQWYKDLNLIPDATGQYYQTHSSPGTYYVITNDLNGCENTSNSIRITGKKSMSLYPNPASYCFGLTFENVTEGSILISIFSSAGIKMAEYRVESISDNFLKEIPIDNLEKGIYIVTVTLDTKETFQNKIIVIK
ncbi:MAG TPA: T9SS type A sorting domain-containing protein, partial [Bacteroidales bacterium]|nr:T9SS type A sorting domain-containing protein [Bacteroidales bacterium]